jgi:hypothetical protein
MRQLIAACQMRTRKNGRRECVRVCQRVSKHKRENKQHENE